MVALGLRNGGFQTDPSGRNKCRVTKVERGVLQMESTAPRRVEAEQSPHQSAGRVADKGAEDYLAVDCSRLNALTMEAIKELKAENNTLRERIEVLERKLAAS